MRYVGNMRRSTPNRFGNQNDRAVFPPGSIIPDAVADDAVMYGQNPMMGQQQMFRTDSRQLETNVENVVDSVVNAAITNEDTAVHRSGSTMEEGESIHGLMDYEGMEFPLPAGGVLRRTESGSSDGFVGSVEDPRNFSPANGLGGRPMETNTNMQGSTGRSQMGMGMTGGQMNRGSGMMGMSDMTGTMTCGPSVRLSDIMCMYAGKNIDVEFMFGADTYVKKSGILSGAGMNFIVLTDPETMQKTICDLTDMKFINISKQSDNM